ncbi:unnamed protein product [Agarophyton chilense]|eukprot:gb/GEZJ01005853.1/.p1 GENE.gb/GEZJ01005853.1/~~gb/GEZJ01005853.1/.p1  ORF type:complete len:369 (-),score=32.13 gb/GEZJ01005853.1/:100-1077(-)
MTLTATPPPATTATKPRARLRTRSLAAVLASVALLLTPLLITHAPILTTSSSSHFDRVAIAARHDWTTATPPPECTAIFAKLATQRVCPPHTQQSCRAPLRWDAFRLGSVWMFSQFGQDAYLFARHFRALARRGVYVDAASNQPVKLSNSYFYDRCLGWKGVCVEANPMYYEPTFRRRSCLLVPTCAGAADNESVRFVRRGELGGVVGDSYKFGNGTQGEVVEMRCIRLQSVLDRARISHVDFLSVDVEGHELQVLHGIDWKRTRVDIISVEVTPSFEGVQRFLQGLGYVQHVVGKESEISPVGNGFLGMDAIFLRADVTLGSPR